MTKSNIKYKVIFKNIKENRIVSELICSPQAAHAYLRQSLIPSKWLWVNGKGYIKVIEVIIEKQA